MRLTGRLSVGEGLGDAEPAVFADDCTVTVPEQLKVTLGGPDGKEIGSVVRAWVQDGALMVEMEVDEHAGAAQADRGPFSTA